MTERKEKTWSKDSAFDREADMEEVTRLCQNSIGKRDTKGFLERKLNFYVNVNFILLPS